jgi:DNA-directed RNA polymerase I, II, and III subunit RPABC5/DNA-directed RNA polymerase subunit N
MVCFTCGFPIAHLYEKYLTLINEYEKNPEDKTPEFLALRDLKVGRHCCRRMFICQQDMYTKIK